MLYQCHIFCDFDGTISGQDIGWELFQRFGQHEPWNAQMIAGILPVREYWQKMAQHLTQPITHELLGDFLRTIPIDAGFQSLLAVSLNHSIPFTIVSDGFDLYIHRFLELHGITEVEIFCNHAELTPGPISGTWCSLMLIRSRRSMNQTSHSVVLESKET